jgi:hypothetical protein
VDVEVVHQVDIEMIALRDFDATPIDSKRHELDRIGQRCRDVQVAPFQLDSNDRRSQEQNGSERPRLV